jgi:hypothetical protein
VIREWMERLMFDPLIDYSHKIEEFGFCQNTSELFEALDYLNVDSRAKKSLLTWATAKYQESTKFEIWKFMFKIRYILFSDDDVCEFYHFMTANYLQDLKVLFESYKEVMLEALKANKELAKKVIELVIAQSAGLYPSWVYVSIQ